LPLRLKPLAEQVIVITGASSGHGLCTAQMAAAQGARVMLAARDASALEQICAEIKANGGTADYLVTDVARQADVERLAERTIERFGGFDTWVNNAGTGAYGEVLDLPVEDHRQVFETNYWGTVYGSMAAVRHLKSKPGGGTLINVGSINSDMAAPILSAYNASKHAVKGFTDSLRIEMLMHKAPVSITLVKPSAIGTPFPQHGRNVTGYRARLPNPLYAPEVTARAILHAAQHQRRSVTVGGVGKLQVLGAKTMPNLFDRIAVGMAGLLASPEEPVPYDPGNLYEPKHDDGQTEGRQKGRGFSTLNIIERHRRTSLGLVAALTAAGSWVAKRRS